MKKYPIGIPIGTGDYLFSQCDMMRFIETKFAGLFKAHGYGEMKSPTIEYYDTFLRAGNAPLEETMYKFADRNGRLLVLRSDSTTPVARVYATKLRQQPLPQRVFYIQNIFRSAEANTGSRSEVLQAGAELIGSGGVKADSEIIALAILALQSAGLAQFHIEIGHAGLFIALCDELTEDADTREEIRTIIEKKNYAALGDILRPYESGTDKRVTGAAASLKQLISMFGGVEVLDEAEKLSVTESALSSVAYLKSLYAELKAAGFADRVRFDMGLVHRIDYYTGIVFQGFAEGAGEPVLSGGRYDALTSAFLADAPAIGFGLNINAVLSCVETQPVRKCDIIHYGSGELGKALEYIEQNGGNFELSCEDSVEESRNLAEQKGVRLIVL